MKTRARLGAAGEAFQQENTKIISNNTHKLFCIQNTGCGVHSVISLWRCFSVLLGTCLSWIGWNQKGLLWRSKLPLALWLRSTSKADELLTITNIDSRANACSWVDYLSVRLSGKSLVLVWPLGKLRPAARRAADQSLTFNSVSDSISSQPVGFSGCFVLLCFLNMFLFQIIVATVLD